jgi:hypothetical protein
MDFGDGVAPSPEGRMGDYAIQAAQNTYNQCLNIGLSCKIGITPMIGQNDAQTERFYIADAQKVLSFANSNSWVRLIAMWSSGRDNGNCAGQAYASPTCSGISQNAWGFINTFKAYK